MMIRDIERQWINTIMGKIVCREYICQLIFLDLTMTSQKAGYSTPSILYWMHSKGTHPDAIIKLKLPIFGDGGEKLRKEINLE